MQKAIQNKGQTTKLALTALLTALVAILAYYGGFIKIGGLASISLTLIPVVLGGALCGPIAGAWLGAVSGIVFLLSPDALFWMDKSLFGTILTVVAKGALSGLCAALVYKALEKKNRYLAVTVSAVVCPVVNTGIFILGCLVFFMDGVRSAATEKGISLFACLIVVYVGLNFVFELLTNIIVSPAILRLINIRKKTK